MVQHREAYGGVKARAGERCAGGVAGQDRDIGVRHVSAQPSGQPGVDLDAGEMAGTVVQQVGGGAITRADFERLGAEVDAFQSPGDDVLLHGLAPAL